VNGLGVVTLLLLQAPGDGWGMVDSRPREVKRLYWELFQTTEVWVTLSPVTADTVAGPRFAFQAFFPGREVKGKPQRIQIKALAGVVATDLSLRVTIDGKTTDLTGRCSPVGHRGFRVHVSAVIRGSGGSWRVREADRAWTPVSVRVGGASWRY